MATIFDYLQWRGDLTFKQAPFNPVDNIILSQLAYLPFDGIVSGPSDGIVIPLADAAARFALLMGEDSVTLGSRLISKEDPLLLETLAGCERYRNLGLTGYVNHIDTLQEKQFSVLTILTTDRSSYIAYRGTDNTLVGWKEDFNMSFSPVVPSQLEAVSYLQKMADQLRGSLRLGGHSKGGNLAVYAASFCGKKIQRRVTAIYSNDAPGFHPSVITSEGYQAIRKKILSFIPQSSVIGMLFEHDDDYTVVKSTASGLMQHEIYSWEITRDDLIRLNTVTQESRFIDRTIKEWVGGLEHDQRQRFIEAFYVILTSTEARSFPELSANWFKNVRIIIQSLSTIDEPTREIILKTLSALFKAAKNNFPALLPKNHP